MDRIRPGLFKRMAKRTFYGVTTNILAENVSVKDSDNGFSVIPQLMVSGREVFV